MADAGDDENVPSWRDIQQESARRVQLPERRRRWRARVFVAAALALGLALLVAGIIWGARWVSRMIDARVAAAERQTQRVFFTTNGVLDEAWLRRWLELDDPESGWSIAPVSAIRERLLAFGQVAGAEVQRLYPEALRVELREHRPYLRVVVPKPNGGREMLLVAETGHVYRGRNYPVAMLRRLPFLDGVPLRRRADGTFSSVAGMAPVAELLNTAERLVPDLLASWQVLDLSGVREPAISPGDRLTVRTANDVAITFATTEFDRQLQRLERVYQEMEQGGLPTVAMIDLSLPQPVLRPRDEPRRPRGPRRF